MKKFNLAAQVTISISTTVEADSLDEAIEIASQREIEAYRFGNDSQYDESWISDHYDGEPQNIHDVK